MVVSELVLQQQLKHTYIACSADSPNIAGWQRRIKALEAHGVETKAQLHQAKAGCPAAQGAQQLMVARSCKQAICKAPHISSCWMLQKPGKSHCSQMLWPLADFQRSQARS